MARNKRFQAEKKFNEQLARNRMQFEKRTAARTEHHTAQRNEMQQQQKANPSKGEDKSVEVRRMEEQWRGELGMLT